MTDNFMAMGAGVFLIVASGNAEGDEAAAQPAADEAEDQAENPTESALVLVNVGHTSVTAVLALDRDGVVRPVASREGAGRSTNDSDYSLRLRHHGLTWLLHHGLAWLLHHWLSWLLHHWLAYRLSYKRLVLGTHVSWLAVHIYFYFFELL